MLGRMQLWVTGWRSAAWTQRPRQDASPSTAGAVSSTWRRGRGASRVGGAMRRARLSESPGSSSVSDLWRWSHSARGPVARQRRRRPPPAEPHTAFAAIEVKVPSDPDWLAAGFGSVWVKRPEGTGHPRRRGDGHHHRRRSASIPHSEEQCGGMGVGTDGMWTCAGTDIVRIDPETDSTVATVKAGKIPRPGTARSRRGPDLGPGRRWRQPGRRQRGRRGTVRADPAAGRLS